MARRSSRHRRRATAAEQAQAAYALLSAAIDLGIVTTDHAHERYELPASVDQREWGIVTGRLLAEGLVRRVGDDHTRRRIANAPTHRQIPDTGRGACSSVSRCACHDSGEAAGAENSLRWRGGLTMTARYRVRDWGVHFENSRSRDYKKLDWVPIPNKHDGKGYRRLIALENGPALFAAWVLIVQVASKCPQRGVLADEDGPLTAEDLAMKTGCPAEVFSQAFDMLCHPKIGWLEVEQLAADDQQSVSTLTEPVSVLTASVSVVPLNRTEENRTEEKRNKGAAVAAGEVRPAKALKVKDTGKAQESIPIPAELDTPEFAQAWGEWKEHLRQKRKPMKPLQEAKLLATWAANGVERTIAAINHSIANGWQGLFEPNAPNNGQRPAQQDDPRGNFAAGKRYLEMFGGGSHE